MPRLRIILLVITDAIVLSLSYLLGVVLQRPALLETDLEEFLSDENGIVRISICVLTILFGLYFVGLYERIRVQVRRHLAEELMLIFGVAFLVQAIASYTRTTIFMPRLSMIIGSTIAFLALILWRVLYAVLLLRMVGRQRIVFFGDTPLVRMLAKHIHDFPEKGFAVAAIVSVEDDPLSTEEPIAGIAALKAASGLAEEITRLAPDRICVAGTYSLHDHVIEHLMDFSMKGLVVESVGELHELLLQRVSLETVTLNQLIFSPAFRPAPWKLLVQDLYGRIMALVGIFLTWPLMLLAALAVRLDSEGPALLRQKRVGQRGRVFEILKFRSMYIDGDQRFGAIRADKNDPRITRLGKVIRISRIDELPQFFNVLRGDMAFVGPRPEMDLYVDKLSQSIALYPQRHRVKPGITGWAQLYHEPELTLDHTRRKLEYDLYYIKNMSPTLDFLIMFHTLRAIILRKGAR